MKIKKPIRIVLKSTAVIVVGLVLSGALFLSFAPQIGTVAIGERLMRMEQSPNFKDGIFQNTIETGMDMGPSKIASTFWQMMTGVENATPKSVVAATPFNAEQFAAMPDSAISVSWFGHSSVILKLEGKVFLIDPVFSERASMFQFMGPKRFDYSEHMTVDQLPEIDAVVISHDHYDHLDYATMKALGEKTDKFYVSLGVGAHLEKWGINPDHITELDWWETVNFDDNIELACTPSRHFSGRGLLDRSKTLWCSWVFNGKNKKVYFSGDSGYTPEFKKIGEKYGPFDFAMVECGQYNENWSNIHMMPEESAQAGADLKAAHVMPIHWGKFVLSLHSWTDPIERFTKASTDKPYQMVTPKVGEIFTIADAPNLAWWEELMEMAMGN